jgi:hypothetical protein
MELAPADPHQQILLSCFIKLLGPLQAHLIFPRKNGQG